LIREAVRSFLGYSMKRLGGGGEDCAGAACALLSGAAAVLVGDRGGDPGAWGEMVAERG